MSRQHHRLQSSGWTAHQRVTWNISTLALRSGVFRFTRCVIWHIGYSLLLDSQPFPFRKTSRALIGYQGFHSIFSSLTFSEGAPKLSEVLYGALRVTWSGGSVLILPGGIRYFQSVAGFTQPLLLGGVLVVFFLVPWFPYERGSKYFEGTASWWQAISLELVFLPSDIVILLWISSCGMIFPSLWRGLFFVEAFTLIIYRMKG